MGRPTARSACTIWHAPCKGEAVGGGALLMVGWRVGALSHTVALSHGVVCSSTPAADAVAVGIPVDEFFAAFGASLKGIRP